RGLCGRLGESLQQLCRSNLGVTADPARSAVVGEAEMENIGPYLPTEVEHAPDMSQQTELQAASLKHQLLHSPRNLETPLVRRRTSCTLIERRLQCPYAKAVERPAGSILPRSRR